MSKKIPSTLVLNDERTCFVGTLKGKVGLASPASTLIVGLDDSFSLEHDSNGVTTQHEIALIPPDVSLAVDAADGTILIVFLDLLKQDFLSLCDEPEQGEFAFPSSDECLSGIRGCFTQSEDEQSTRAAIDNVFSLLDACRGDSLSCDARVRKVADLIKADIASNLSVEELSESVCLSVPQLHHIFKRQTGITLRKYRIWRRIFIAMTQHGKGASLTDAALDAGFNDASHFIRAFKEVYGTSPKKLLATTEALSILSDEEG